MENWSGHKIVYELRKAGHRPIDVARKSGRSATMINHVIHHGKVSKHVRKCIAEMIGVNIKTIWAGYYFPRNHRPDKRLNS